MSDGFVFECGIIGGRRLQSTIRHIFTHLRNPRDTSPCRTKEKRIGITCPSAMVSASSYILNNIISLVPIERGFEFSSKVVFNIHSVGKGLCFAFIKWDYGKRDLKTWTSTGCNMLVYIHFTSIFKISFMP